VSPQDGITRGGPLVTPLLICRAVSPTCSLFNVHDEGDPVESLTHINLLREKYKNGSTRRRISFVMHYDTADEYDRWTNGGTESLPHFAIASRTVQVAQLLQRDRAAGCVSFGQK